MRFHCGISFSWKTIKKYLFPILIGLLAYFGFVNSGVIIVNAVNNYDTQYNITIPNYDDLYDDFFCGNESIKDFLHNFINNYNENNSLYNIIIVPKLEYGQTTLNDNYLAFYTYKKSKSSYNRFTFYGNSIGNINIGYLYKDDANALADYSYYIKLDSCNSAVSTSTSFQKYLDYIYGNYSPNNYGQKTDEDSQGFMYTGGWFNATLFIASYNDNQIFNNNDSFTLNTTNWFYWSNRVLNYKSIYNSYYTSSVNYWKKLHITNNDTIYNYLDNVVSYWDLKDTFPNEDDNNNSFIDYKDKLGTLYANFLPSQINNFNIQMSFNVPNDMTSFEYRQNTTFVSNCFARVNNNDNYYSYVSLPCSFETDDTFDSSSFGKYKFLNFEFYDSNNNVITDFSNYDKLFVYIDFSYFDDTLSKYISNLSIISNGNTLYQDYFSGTIFDNFDNLPTLFKMFISSNTSSDYSYVKARTKTSSFSDNYYFLYLQQYNTSSLNPIGGTQIIGRESFQSFQVSNTNNIGYMIFQQQNNQNNLTTPNNLELVFSNNIIISLNNIANNNFYYYDNTTITNNTINPTYDNVASNNYDLSEFFSIVNNYIEDASDKVIQFHNIVQDFYDSMPLYLQTTIYVLFILFCSYFLYREIRR